MIKFAQVRIDVTVAESQVFSSFVGHYLTAFSSVRCTLTVSCEVWAAGIPRPKVACDRTKMP
jgi:hypothetical protein